MLAETWFSASVVLLCIKPEVMFSGGFKSEVETFYGAVVPLDTQYEQRLQIVPHRNHKMVPHAQHFHS